MLKVSKVIRVKVDRGKKNPLRAGEIRAAYVVRNGMRARAPARSHARDHLVFASFPLLDLRQCALRASSRLYFYLTHGGASARRAEVSRS